MSTLAALVVDDNLPRSIEIKEILISSGFSSFDIEICSSISSATKHFLQKRVDLLIVDISIPQISGDAPLPNGGQELLRQLDELKPEIVEPKWTLAITAYADSAKLTSVEFQYRLVSVLNSTVGSNEWKGQLLSFAKKIVASENESHAVNEVDVCFVTALRSPELDGILGLPIKWGLKSVSPFFASQVSGVLEVPGKEISVEAFSFDKMGLVAMSYLTSSILSVIRPKIMVLTGICAAVSDSVRLGDIIVAESSWNWQSGKQRAGDDFQFDSDSIPASAALVASAKHQAESNENRFKLMAAGQHIKSQKDIIPAIHVGPMASGSVVVADEAIKQNIVAQNRKVLALDMEAYAFYAAQRFSRAQTTKFLTIKAVCDRADASKADELQNMCSVRSAQFAEMVIRKSLDDA